MAASATIAAASASLNTAFGDLGTKLNKMGRKDKANGWTKGNYGPPVNVAFNAAGVSLDLASGVNFELIMTGNTTLGLPTNINPGQSGIISVIQDATGSRTMAFNSIFKFAAGTAFSLTTTPNAVDEVCYYVKSATEIVLTRITDVR